MATLSARLDKLEQAATPEDARIIWLSVCTATRDAAPMNDDDVMGVHSMGRKVTRQPGETVADMKARAVRLVPDAMLWMVVHGNREASRAVFEGCTEAVPMLH